MSEKPLLLSPAKFGVPVERFSPAEYLRWAAIAIGLLMVLVGAADAVSRLAKFALGEQSAFTAFGPAAAINVFGADGAAANPFFQARATTTPITPARLSIPALGIMAAVEQVGTKADGSMGTPTNFADVAWYELGSRPGEEGNAVIAGHVNNALTKAGVFEHLSELHIGDSVIIEDASGKALQYRVSETAQYMTGEAPVAAIFSRTGPSQLALITCDGDWVPSEHSFNKRLVVIARLAE